MPTERRRVLKSIGALATATVVPVGTTLADEGEETAGLRVAHASSDAPAVDVYVDGTRAVAGLEFRAVTEYLEVATGSHEIAVNVAGTETTVFGPVTLDLAAEDYTAIARGEVSSDDTRFTVDVAQDTNGADLDDESRVRAVHASPDAPAVDVTVNDGAATLFGDLSYSGVSDYAVVPADEYEIEIRPAGGGEPVFETVAELAAGSTYTAFAVGYLTPDDEPADEPFGLVLSEDATAPPRGDGEDDREREEEKEDENDDEGEDDRGRSRQTGGGGRRDRGHEE